MARAISWLAQLVAAMIMGQTLYFKFSGAPESIDIFTKLEMEPYGRIGTGIAELVASVLLLFSPTAWVGALIGVVLMSGALFFHIAMLGIESQNDGGLLFYYAVTVWMCCAFILLIRRYQLPFLKSRMY